MRIGDLILSYIPPVILLCIAGILVWRRLSAEFPFFFSSVVYAAAAGVLRTAVVYDAFLYFWLYWISEALYGVLALAVLREIFHRVFALPHAAFQWVRLLLPGALFLILTLSVWEMLYHPLGRNPRIVSGIYWFDFGVHLLEGLILLLVLGLTTVFPVSWRRYEFGILAGFGINASVTMLAYLFRFEWGSRYELFFRYGPPVGYLLATLIWLHAFLQPPESLPKAQIGRDEMLGVVRRSRELLEKIEKVLGLRRHFAIPPA